jgi:hypothetical protein
MPQVGDGGDAEHTFGVFDEEPLLMEDGEDSADVLEMFHPRAVVDEDIVEEDEDEAAEEWVEHIVHQCLKCGWGIVEPKRHDEELVEAIVSPKCRLLNISGVHANLVVAGAEVQLGEESGAVKLVEELVHHQASLIVMALRA